MNIISLDINWLFIYLIRRKIKWKINDIFRCFLINVINSRFLNVKNINKNDDKSCINIILTCKINEFFSTPNRQISLFLTSHDLEIHIAFCIPLWRFNGHRFFILRNVVKAATAFFIDRSNVLERDVEKRMPDLCQSEPRQKEKCESSWKMHLQSIFKPSCKSWFTNKEFPQ